MTQLAPARRARASVGGQAVRGVYAAAELLTVSGGRRWLPVLSIRLAAALDDVLPARDMTLRYLRGAGWVNPAGMLRRGVLTCAGWATVDGVLGDGPVNVAGGGLALFDGQMDRSARWMDAVRAAGTVPVVVSAAGPGDDLIVLGRAGLAVTAPGRLFDRGAGLAPPT